MKPPTLHEYTFRVDIKVQTTDDPDMAEGKLDDILYERLIKTGSGLEVGGIELDYTVELEDPDDE